MVSAQHIILVRRRTLDKIFLHLRLNHGRCISSGSRIVAKTLLQAPIKLRSRPPTSFKASETSVFSTTKKDKRRMKHSLLLSKVRKSSEKATGQRKRRRPSKKLVTTLENLADALPEVESRSLSESKSSKGDQGVITQTLKSKPGTAKKMERIVKQEKERFGRNMAALTQTSAVASDSQSAAEDSQMNSRWAALRTHLANTMGKT
jgi:ribosome biogenesis protein SLX9